MKDDPCSGTHRQQSGKRTNNIQQEITSDSNGFLEARLEAEENIVESKANVEIVNQEIRKVDHRVKYVPTNPEPSEVLQVVFIDKLHRRTISNNNTKLFDDIQIQWKHS